MPRDDVGSVYPEQLAIGPGTQCDIIQMPGQNSISIKWMGGGSLSIVGSSLSVGCTFAFANLYTLAITEIVNTNLMGTISLLASGVTTTVQVLRYKTPGD